MSDTHIQSDSGLWVPPEYRKPKAGQNAAGVVEKVVYFENGAGHILIPMIHDSPMRQGYVRKEAKTVKEISDLSRRFERQKQMEFDSKDVLLHMSEEKRIEGIIDRLRNRMLSSSCGPYERDFIKAAIPKLRAQVDKHKRGTEMCFHQEAYEAGH